MSVPKKLVISTICIAITVIIGLSIYQLHFVPKEYESSGVFFNGALLEYKNIVARKNDETGLRLKYIGTVDSVAPDTENPDADFECNKRILLKSRLYRDDYGRYYLYRSNGDLLMLEAALEKSSVELKITHYALQITERRLPVG